MSHSLFSFRELLLTLVLASPPRWHISAPYLLAHRHRLSMLCLTRGLAIVRAGEEAWSVCARDMCACVCLCVCVYSLGARPEHWPARF